MNGAVKFLKLLVLRICSLEVVKLYSTGFMNVFSIPSRFWMVKSVFMTLPVIKHSFWFNLDGDYLLFKVF